jgi:hypothetical protein
MNNYLTAWHRPAIIGGLLMLSGYVVRCSDICH